jgi:hypothetical protein
MSMTKYGARPDQTSKTASGTPGTLTVKPPVVPETIKKKITTQDKAPPKR